LRWIKKIVDLILYGNLWIALGALLLCLQTQYILEDSWKCNDLTAFVFFSTWLLYALHRIVGILRLKDFLEIERYSVIARFRRHIIVYAILAGLGAIWYFLQLTFLLKVAVVLPGFFSMAYVLPFFGKKRRLRDFDQIKIYLVALVWAWVTVVLPAVYYGHGFSWSLVLMFVERTLFVFAITLPFDIRDLQVDGHSKVSTIPSEIGVKKANTLAILLLSIGLGLAFINFALQYYSAIILFALMGSFISTAYLVYLSKPERHDYFYSGLMDGTMIFQGLLVYLLSLI